MVGKKFFKQTIKDVDVTGRTILLRADYNVPLNDQGEISDDFRLRASLPTLEYLLRFGCKVVIISHLGRPDGREERYSLERVAKALASLLSRPVRFVDQAVGDKVRMAVKRAPAGSVIMLENLRFYHEEEDNDETFARRLAQDSTASFFVQDGFGVVHRAHASTAAINNYLPGLAGLLLEKEYLALTGSIISPKRPLVAIMGGAKVSDKIELVERFVRSADKVIIGGALANTFLSYQGYSMGRSKVEAGQEAVVERIMRVVDEEIGADKADDSFILPVDVAVADKISASAQRREVDRTEVNQNDIVLDLGPKSIERVAGLVRQAGTVIWNGTLGYAELEQFSFASARLALELATHPNVVSIIGGGDTADFVIKWDVRRGQSFTHVSTGGGASLELLAGKKLPGIESLLDAKR